MQPLRRLARDAAKSLVVGTLFIYPVAIYLAEDYLSPSQLTAGLLFLVAARVLFAAWIKPEHHWRDLVIAALLGAAAFTVLFLLPAVRIEWLRLYPAVFTLAILATFFVSLFHGMPMVERIARVVHSDLTPQGVAHCRRVTVAWCGLLTLNLAISLYTAFATSLKIWSLYNGVIVYCMFAAMLGGEYLLRRHLQRGWDQP